MLTLPDLKSKQVLFIQMERGAKNRLFFRNENVVFEKNREIIDQASCHRLLTVFVIGDFSFTSGLIREAKKRGVSLFFLNHNFGCYAAFSARADGNYLLRLAQYALTPEQELHIAKNLVENKIKNQISLLKALKKSVDTTFMNDVLGGVHGAEEVKGLLGFEGTASKKFFKHYFGELNWVRRTPRVKPDIPNFLLDMGYTILFNFVDSLLQLFGFDTYKGCYHKLFFQRKSLTCDIVEPFRSIIDKQILKSYRLKQIDDKDFFVDKNGKVSLSYDKSQKYAKIFMEAIMDNKENIYLYVQKYYRFIMKGGAMPQFSVLRKGKK